MQWLDKNLRFVFHFTPTSAFWLNAIEGSFAKLTKKRLKRSVFPILARTQKCHPPISYQRKPKTLRLDQGPNKIIATVRRGHRVIDSLH
jgi:hypothetical protein